MDKQEEKEVFTLPTVIRNISKTGDVCWTDPREKDHQILR